MTVMLAFLVLSAPFALAALFTWAAHRGDAALTGFRNEFGDPDSYRVWHDADAVRTRFELSPSWPASGGTGERR